MTTEIVVSVENRPGTLAKLAHTLANADVNIEALAGIGLDGDFMVRLIADEPSKALDALRAARFNVTEATEILEATLEDRPGTLSELCGKLGSLGINIDALYIRGCSPDGIRIALAVDDVEKAKEVLQTTRLSGAR